METLFEKTEMGSMQDKKPARLTIEGFVPREEELFITKLSGGEKPNFQLMYSLGADAFINAFNQRLSVWTLHGLYIPTACDVPFELDPVDDPYTKPAFVEFYDDNNIVNAEEHLRLTFQGIVLEGFLISLQLQDYSQDGVEGSMYQLKMLAKRPNAKQPPKATTIPEEEQAAPETIPSAKPEESTYGVGANFPPRVGPSGRSIE